MYDIRMAGKRDVVLAFFKDRLRSLKEQGEESHEALEHALIALLEHMPQKSAHHNGVMIHVEGDVRPEQAHITLMVESIVLAGG